MIERFKHSLHCTTQLKAEGSEMMDNLAPRPTISTKTCRYWLNGGCFNPYCSFLHPPHGTVPADAISKSSIPCHFFQRGNCDRGANCSFMHAPPLSLPRLPQLNFPLTSPSNPEINSQLCQEQNDSPCSSDKSSNSDVSFDVIVGDNPSYYLQGADWYRPFNDLPCQIQTRYENQKYYSLSENSLRRSSPSGRKRPLEQEAESRIRHTGEQPERKQRRLDTSLAAVACTEMYTADDEGQNGHTTYEGVLSSQLRDRIRFPERSTCASTCHNDERRGLPSGCLARHMEPVCGRCSRERERGLGKRNGINASRFSPPKSLAEFKRAKTGMEMKDNSCYDFEGPKSLSVLLKKKREALSRGEIDFAANKN